MNSEEKELSRVIEVIKVVGYIIAFLPITLSIWVFHHNRVLIQNGEVSGMSGIEIAQPLYEQWQQVRSVGYLLLISLAILIGVIWGIARTNRNKSMDSIAIMFYTDVLISAFLLTFSFAIGGYLTDLYLILLEVTGG
ncbi:MAG: hypothetical protein QY318_02275 [Candidatus Dojkabacteria bacterium]|nr:MAG: hypothetical protein QY318_02275 [Candidatus Dojkabacteria bacterium]